MGDAYWEAGGWVGPLVGAAVTEGLAGDGDLGSEVGMTASEGEAETA